MRKPVLLYNQTHIDLAYTNKEVSVKLAPIILITFLINLIIPTSWACTGIELKAKDNSYVNGRTVEFGISLHLSGVIIPRNYAFKGTLPDGTTGLVYKSKYAAVGARMFGEVAIADGINEKGLAIGDFYFPGYAGYTKVTAENKNQALSPTEFSNWILSQFATVDEVKAGIKSVVIVATTPKGWPILPPFHYVIYDKSGKSLVIEPLNGQLKVYDNPIGTFTNSPTFDWHLTNLINYINLSPVNITSLDVNGYRLQPFGSGSGLHGMPGDFTPPSRFVRAAIFSSTAIPSDNAQQAVLQAFHILNQFDIPVGAVRQKESESVNSEYTMATTVKDASNLKYYFRTFEDQTIKVVDLNTFDWNAAAIKTYPMDSQQPIVDISKTAK